jgi:AcrR family transcriptional regulator
MPRARKTPDRPTEADESTDVEASAGAVPSTRTKSGGAKGSRKSSPAPAAGGSNGGTRERLLAAARKVLIEDGLTAVTTRRVATEANVNQALVHYHFGSIENLLLDVLDTVAHDTRRAERIFYGSGDLRAKWRTFMGDLVGHEVADGTTKLWAETVVMVSSKPETRERYVDTIASPTHERLLEVVRAGLPEGSTDEEIEGLTALILAVRKAISLDSLVGWNRGQDELLRLVDNLIAERIAPPGEEPSESDDAWPGRRTGR